MNDPINLDAPFEEFASEAKTKHWTADELTAARDGLIDRIKQIDAQLEHPTPSRGAFWRTSVQTARKYFVRKLGLLDGISATLAPRPAASVTKKPGGYGFLMTFLHKGDHLVVATRRNPADVWAEMVAEESASGGTAPAMIAYLNLTEEAAAKLPDGVWIDDL